jgi:hypothetical protein
MPPESVQWFREKDMRKSRTYSALRESFFTQRAVGETTRRKEFNHE